MENLNNIKKVWNKSKVLESIKKLNKTIDYRGEKINYKTLVTSIPFLLNSTVGKDRRYEEYNVANNSYRLEVLKRPITDKLTIYKKGEKFDINLFVIAFKRSVDSRKNTMLFIDEDNFFSDTWIDKEKLEWDVNSIYFGNNEYKLNVKSFKYKNNVYSCNDVWDKLSDIPVNNEDEIEEKFFGFWVGTDKFEIWHWVEEKFDISVAEDLLYNK